MRRLIAASALALVAPFTLAVTTAEPAHAGPMSGSMSYTEYKGVFDNELQDVVAAFCNCHGEYVPDGDGKDWTHEVHYWGGDCGCQDAYVEFGNKDGDATWKARWKEYRDPIGRLLDSTYWNPK